MGDEGVGRGLRMARWVEMGRRASKREKERERERERITVVSESGYCLQS